MVGWGLCVLLSCSVRTQSSSLKLRQLRSGCSPALPALSPHLTHGTISKFLFRFCSISVQSVPDSVLIR